MVGVHVSSARDARDQVADDFPLARINLTLKFRHLGVKLNFQLRLGFYFTTGLLFTCKTRPPSQSFEFADAPSGARSSASRARTSLSIFEYVSSRIARYAAISPFASSTACRNRAVFSARETHRTHTRQSPRARARPRRIRVAIAHAPSRAALTMACASFSAVMSF